MKAITALTLALALLFAASHADAKGKKKHHGKKPASTSTTKDSGKTAEPKK